MQGGTTFTFVTDDIESALDQAMRAAGGKDVVLAGGASPPFMRETAQALADALPHGQTRTLEGQDHNVAPEVIAR